MKSLVVKAGWTAFVIPLVFTALASGCGGGGGKIAVTPILLGPTAVGTPGTGRVTIVTPAVVSKTLPPRTADFASVCQKSDQKTFTSPETVIDPNRSYTATIRTEKGDMTIELAPDVAPVTVNNFVFLACKGFYEGVTFHRVIPGFVAQGGDPTGLGSGGPGYAIPDELSDQPFERGTVGMARTTNPDTGGSQFFICYEAQPDLDGKYTVFGKVTAGLDVLNSLTPRDPQTNPNAPPGDKILEITVQEH